MIKLITAALQAYIAYVGWGQRKFIYDLEDEIDHCAADGSPAAKLRIERLAKRKSLERKCVCRPLNGDTH
tara:strand:- start:1648 stop:1857 length:210 start_codon:yes stop_codon:yes gene_type:complete